MTRKDIIIIAVLANMGVLAILFMLAFRTDEEKATEPELKYTIEAEPTHSKETDEIIAKPEQPDEIDAVLGDLNPIALVQQPSNEEDSFQIWDNEPSHLEPVEAPHEF